MIPYLNQYQREQMVVLALTQFALEEMANDKHFSFASKDIKSGRTFAQRAYSAIENVLDEKERLRINSFAKRHRILIIPKEKPQKDETIIKTEILRDLTCFAISNHCTGCQKDFRRCELRIALEAVGAPPAHEDGNKVCRFSQ